MREWTITMSWSPSPGSGLHSDSKDGRLVMKRSSMLSFLVVKSTICWRLQLWSISRKRPLSWVGVCWLSEVSVSQLIPGKFRSPPTHITEFLCCWQMLSTEEQSPSKYSASLEGGRYRAPTTKDLCPLNDIFMNTLSHWVSQDNCSTVRLFFVAMRTPPPCLSFRSFLVTLYPAGNISELCTSAFNHVSVPIIISGLVELMRTPTSSFLFWILWKLMVNVENAGLSFPLWLLHFFLAGDDVTP